MLSIHLFVFQIRSDKENFTKVFYYLSGIGVDQPPVGVFEVDRNTGFIKINSILDREEIPFYNVKASLYTLFEITEMLTKSIIFIYLL